MLQVDRKLVKQTVMTSVYGVTFVGAREQIKRRLQEKGVITDDRQLFAASCYAAKVRNTFCIVNFELLNFQQSLFWKEMIRTLLFLWKIE